MKDIIVVRHAEAEHLVKSVMGGRNETLLTLTGEQQAVKTANAIKELLAGSTPKIYSSDQMRAVQTAKVMAEEFEVEPIFASELRSVDNGLAKDMSPDEANNSISPMAKPRIDWIPWPKAESWRMLFRRVSGFMDKLRSYDGDLVIVTHGKTLIALFQWWMGYTEERLEEFSIGIVNENTRLKNWYISYGFNETGLKRFPHLPFEVCFMEKPV